MQFSQNMDLRPMSVITVRPHFSNPRSHPSPMRPVPLRPLVSSSSIQCAIPRSPPISVRPVPPFHPISAPCVKCPSPTVSPLVVSSPRSFHNAWQPHRASLVGVLFFSEHKAYRLTYFYINLDFVNFFRTPVRDPPRSPSCKDIDTMRNTCISMTLLLLHSKPFFLQSSSN